MSKFLRDLAHCKYESYAKEEIDEMLPNLDKLEEIESKLTEVESKIIELENIINTKQNNVLSGTTDPASDLGNDGDIYLKYE